MKKTKKILLTNGRIKSFFCFLNSCNTILIIIFNQSIQTKNKNKKQKTNLNYFRGNSHNGYLYFTLRRKFTNYGECLCNVNLFHRKTKQKPTFEACIMLALTSEKFAYSASIFLKSSIIFKFVVGIAGVDSKKPDEVFRNLRQNSSIAEIQEKREHFKIDSFSPLRELFAIMLFTKVVVLEEPNSSFFFFFIYFFIIFFFFPSLHAYIS